MNNQRSPGALRREYDRLRAELERAQETSALPESPAGRAELNDLLIRQRLGS